MLSIYKDGTGSGQDVRLPHTYNGITLNNPVDDETNTYEINSVSPVTNFNETLEPHETRDGTEVGSIFKVARTVNVAGTIRAPSLAVLHDKIKALAAAFDPAKVAVENLDSDGFLPYDFSVPTSDTTTYPSGLVPSRYYARSRRQVEPIIDYSRGHAALFEIPLLMVDPRRYLQTASQRVGAGVADNAAADYFSWPLVTILMAGAGSATFTASNSTLSRSLVLNLSSLVNTDSVVVDMENRTIKKNGLSAESLFVSGDYWWINPGTNTLALLNTTNATVTTSWRSAFCL